MMIYIGQKTGMKGYMFMRSNNAIFMGATAVFDENLFSKCKDSQQTPRMTDYRMPEKPQTSKPDEIDSTSNHDAEVPSIPKKNPPRAAKDRQYHPNDNLPGEPHGEHEVPPRTPSPQPGPAVPPPLQRQRRVWP